MTLTLQIIIDALSAGGMFALMALGIGLIFGIMRLINMAHGEFVMIGGYMLFFLVGRPEFLMAFIAIAVVIGLALGTERLVFRQLRQVNPATLLVASFTVSFFLQHIMVMAVGSRQKPLNFAYALTEHVAIGGLHVPKLQIVTVIVTFVLLLGLGLFLRRTRFGVQMRAAAEDFAMARLLGVRGNRVIAVAFAISGLLAGFVSLLFVAQTGTLAPWMGIQPALIGFVATVIGGLGSLTGAVLGGFLVGTITVILQFILPLDLRPFREPIMFSILFFVLLVRPQGLILVRAAKERV
jgi:branched-chain amino acid transport system permease protein|tara:strand:- start:524 stop:1408 length:885 start_codon:yes stop_codon:yes gene_type:complete